MLIVCVNENGRRIGEAHHRAKLSDADVDLIRELREAHGISYEEIAKKFDVSKSEIAEICRYEIRAQAPAAFRRKKNGV